MPPGLLLVIAAGIMQGSFATPMKRTTGWAWEHTWLVWSVTALIAAPLGMAFVSIPDFWEVYAQTSPRLIVLVAVFGFVWGISGVMFGQGVARVGLALTFGIILGMSSALGSLIPLFSLHSEELLTRTGLLTLAGVFLQTLGVIACAAAGRRREQYDAADKKGSMTVGLLICLVSGLMAPMLNVGLAYGADIVAAAERMGAAKVDAVNAIWPLLFGSGFLANGGYCWYQLSKNAHWDKFVRVRPAANLGWAVFMGLLWIGGYFLYGYGSQQLGPLGVVLGWPIMMSSMVLTGGGWGAITGEWKGAPRSAKRWMTIGVLLLIIGIAVIGVASRPVAAV